MAAAAVPLVTMAAGGISSYFANKQASKASQPSGAEQQAQQAQTGAANQMASTGGQLTRLGMPQMEQSARYFSTLASGNRSAMTQALSPEIGAVNDVYGGATRTLSRFLKGPEKDVQMAEAERERAGSIGRLFGGGRAAAAGQLGSMGGAAVGAGQQGQQGAAGVFGQQAVMGQQNRYAGAQLQQQTGADFGGLMFQLLKGFQGKGNDSSSAATNLFSRPTVPNTSYFMPGGSSQGMGG